MELNPSMLLNLLYRQTYRRYFGTRFKADEANTTPLLGRSCIDKRVKHNKVTHH